MVIIPTQPMKLIDSLLRTQRLLQRLQRTVRILSCQLILISNISFSGETHESFISVHT